MEKKETKEIKNSYDIRIKMTEDEFLVIETEANNDEYNRFINDVSDTNHDFATLGSVTVKKAIIFYVAKKPNDNDEERSK